MSKEIICENFELTVGEEGRGVALTFDVDDIPQKNLDYVKSLLMDSKGFHVVLHSKEADVAVLFPFEDEGGVAIGEEIKTTYGNLFIVGLGEGAAAGESAIVFARELPL